MNSMHSLLPATVDYNGIPLRGSNVSGSYGPVLILHGAGNACIAHWCDLMQSLAAQDVACAGFDFVGHGRTGGALVGSSLAHRTQQAWAMSAAMPRSPTTLLGASMGAYVAIRALERLIEVSRLILIVPGIYAAAAYDVPFGPNFSALIRQPDSWAESDAIARLAAFAGETLIVAGEEDTVIPRAIPERLAAAAQDARLMWIPAGHRFSPCFERMPGAQTVFHERLGTFVKHGGLGFPRNFIFQA